MYFGQSPHHFLHHPQHVLEERPLVPLILDAIHHQLPQLTRSVASDRVHVWGHLTSTHQPKDLQIQVKLAVYVKCLVLNSDHRQKDIFKYVKVKLSETHALKTKQTKM